MPAVTSCQIENRKQCTEQIDDLSQAQRQGINLVSIRQSRIRQKWHSHAVAEAFTPANCDANEDIFPLCVQLYLFPPG